jgi:hypothetical protein
MIKGWDVVVSIPGKRLNHVLLLQEFQKDKLTMQDPEGGTKKTNLLDLLKDMQNAKTGGFGIIKPEFL